MTDKIEIYPLEASLGGNNTVYIACEHRGCRQNYAICLNILKAYQEGRRKPDDYCSSEIGRNLCQAKKMRAEEEAAGHALYFKPRAKVEVKAPEAPKSYIVPSSIKSSEGYKRGYSHAGAVLGKKDKPAPIKSTPAPKPVAPKVMDMGDVVSQMAREHAAGVKADPIPPKPREETMLEKARRLREQARGNT